MHKFGLAAILSLAVLSSPANAEKLEVTHWWTSGSEAAAVKVLADAFNKTGNVWVDGAIAGSGGTARPLIVSRIMGGDPMGATQFTHGSAMRELIQAGKMRDITDVAKRKGWTDKIYPPSLLQSCTFEDRIYCVPSNIHSQQWLWLSTKVYKDAGLPVPKNWNEFVASAPALEQKGVVPLALGRGPVPIWIAFHALYLGLGGPEAYLKTFKDKDAEFVEGPQIAGVFKALDEARKLAAKSKVQQWNLAAQMQIEGRAAGQIMGDWIQGEFNRAGMKPGQDYECLLGMGMNDFISANGDAFFFPKTADAKKIAAQDTLAAVISDPKVQTDFASVKGALPVRTDVHPADNNVCLERGLQALRAGHVVDSVNQLLSPDSITRMTDLMVEFFAEMSISPEQAQQEFADLIASAD
ncbi:ABC transporter substrate binding protein (sugar) [Agrobacterium tumefaciens str. Cherry 2E-2-2]|nr:ABC transporter substrate binding protein (sugar) [Agrobacterium tumefaciens str. Cherry 2E-2-2]